MFTLANKAAPNEFLEKLKQYGIGAVQFGPHEIRFVFHRDLTPSDIVKVQEVLASIT